MNFVPNMALITVNSKEAHDTKIFISLLGRAFKMMKNGIYFILIVFLFLVVELFKILIYAN